MELKNYLTSDTHLDLRHEKTLGENIRSLYYFLHRHITCQKDCSVDLFDQAHLKHNNTLKCKHIKWSFCYCYIFA